MEQIKDGLSIDLSKVESIERFLNGCIIYISGKPYPWNVSYETALQLKEINERSSLSKIIP